MCAVHISICIFVDTALQKTKIYSRLLHALNRVFFFLIDFGNYLVVVVTKLASQLINITFIAKYLDYVIF